MPVPPAIRSTVDGLVASCSSTRSGVRLVITCAINASRPVPPFRMLYVRAA